MKLFANMLFMIYSFRRINELVTKKETIKEENDTKVNTIEIKTKPKEKKNIMIKDERFSMGGVFYSGNEKFVYLCNINGNDYGVFIDDNMIEKPKIKRIKMNDYYFEGCYLTEEAFKSLINYLYSVKKYRWLLEKMIQEETVNGYA